MQGPRTRIAAGSFGDRFTAGGPFRALPPRENYKNVLAAGIKDVPTLEQIVTTLLKQANAGNPQLMGQLADRLDGRVPQTVSDAEGNVLQPVAAQNRTLGVSKIEKNRNGAPFSNHPRCRLFGRGGASVRSSRAYCRPLVSVAGGWATESACSNWFRADF